LRACFIVHYTTVSARGSTLQIVVHRLGFSAQHTLDDSVVMVRAAALQQIKSHEV